ncbi:MAG TPA: ribosome recycling factor [Longimicrobiales bacterium]|nr:ribosome recycling factor [Longimicrobiales bacterium]
MPTIKQMREHMDAAVDAMRREFSSVRTGKATPALLDTVRVDAYGSKMPLNQVATINTPEPRLMVVQPWDKSLMGEIERGIQGSGLGLNPSNDGNVIRVPIPPLSEERRKDMVRLLHKMAEEGKISVRHARQEANKEIKQREHDHEISEDEARRQQEQVQTITDEYVARIDELMKVKEAEVMEV